MRANLLVVVILSEAKNLSRPSATTLRKNLMDLKG
jgi:hypothetical protein